MTVQVGQRLENALRFPVGGAGGGDRTGSGKDLDEATGDPRLHLEIALGDVGGLFGEEAYQEGEDWEAGEEGEAQPRVNEPEGHDAADSRDGIGDRPDHVRRHSSGVGRVARQAAGDVTWAELLGRTCAQAEQVAQDGVAEPGRRLGRGGTGCEVLNRVANDEGGDHERCPPQP